MTFTLQGADKFLYIHRYRLQHGGRPMSFSGELRDDDRTDHDVGGDSSVTVLGPRATREFAPTSVRPNRQVVVTITALGYGSFGRVTETLPAGFSYVSSDLDAEQVSVTGQDVRFTLQGPDKTFTYTVNATSTVGTYDFYR